MFRMPEIVNNSMFKLPWNFIRNATKYKSQNKHKKNIWANQLYKGPEIAQIQVVGSGSPGDPGSIYLNVDEKR